MKSLFKFYLVTVACFMNVALPVRADMDSSSYSITNDVISIGGGGQTSGNYHYQDVIGEMGSGNMKSQNYIMDAGFLATLGNEEALTFRILDGGVTLGTLTGDAAHSGTAQFEVATTSQGGYVVELLGNSLSSSSHTLSSLEETSASLPGTEQFGLNLMKNDNPVCGQDPSGGYGEAASGYDASDKFKFRSGDIVAQTSRPSGYTGYTISFLANISGKTDAGDYSTSLTAVATGRF